MCSLWDSLYPCVPVVGRSTYEAFPFFHFSCVSCFSFLFLSLSFWMSLPSFSRVCFFEHHVPWSEFPFFALWDRRKGGFLCCCCCSFFERLFRLERMFRRYWKASCDVWDLFLSWRGCNLWLMHCFTINFLTLRGFLKLIETRESPLFEYINRASATNKRLIN